MNSSQHRCMNQAPASENQTQQRSLNSSLEATVGSLLVHLGGMLLNGSTSSLPNSPLQPSVTSITYGPWLYKEPQVTQVIRSNRLRWLGHIWRSPENNQTRAYTFKNPMGSRTKGRPPTRWIDDVENDLKTLNIKNWQRVAAHRWNWRKRAVEAAKT
ncbi:endonuclease-reverse transcriptase [Trichonephila clavipes]|nr:endonuclease-reverse transcriptase [Trichonephila clavipes]